MLAFDGNQCSKRLRTIASPASRLLSGRQVQVAFSHHRRHGILLPEGVLTIGSVGLAIVSVAIVHLAVVVIAASSILSLRDLLSYTRRADLCMADLPTQIRRSCH